MGTVHPFPARCAPDSVPHYEQTLELALLLAILEALPRRARRKVSVALEDLHRARPGEATRAAAYIASGMVENSR